ncbi:hypothetical protein [Nocardia sp. NPDC020380]|uniref:hypothetical protein n=1 Tax=Nocardia sp. NPDC020380 TaxID=3364309 RepID=UPI0037AF5067
MTAEPVRRSRRWAANTATCTSLAALALLGTLTRPFDWEATALILAIATVALVQVLRRPSDSPAAPRLSATNPRLSATDSRPSASDPRPPATDSRPSASDPRPPATDSRPSTTDPRQPTTIPRLSPADSRRRLSALLWSALVLAALGWELFAWSRQSAWDVPDPSHPTLSTLLSPLIDHGPGCFVAWFVWLAAGWRLLR